MEIKYSAKDGNNNGAAPEYRRLTINNYMRTSLNISKLRGNSKDGFYYKLEGSVPKQNNGVAGSEEFTTKIGEYWRVNPHNKPRTSLIQRIREPPRHAVNTIIYSTYMNYQDQYLWEENKSGQAASGEERVIKIINNYDSDITFTYTPGKPREVSEFDPVKENIR